MDTTTGRFAFLRQLLADGIDIMFGNPGTSEQNLLDAMGAFPELRYVLALHEGTAVAMADSYARARLSQGSDDSPRPSLVQLHSYAGLANGLGMMYYARRGYTPMVVIAGEAGLKYEALDGQMAADLLGMARPFVKSDYNGPCAWRVVDPGSLLRLLRRAIKAAVTPPMGPVFLALPMDILELPNAEPIVPTSLLRTRIAPEAESIPLAAKLLAPAQNPLIVMGDGIAASRAQEELVQVAEQIGATVWGGNCSEVNMPASHPLFAGYGGHMFGADSMIYTAAADVVLICGTTVLPEVFPALEGVFAPNAKVIQFDLNTAEVAKNFPVAVGAVADPKRALGLLAEELARSMTANQTEQAARRRQDKAEQKRKTHDQARQRDAENRERIPLVASRFFEELALRLPEGSLIFDEALTHSPELLRYLPQDLPGTYFQTRAGMLGTGLPGALGLKLAHPDRVVFGFSGDGGSISTIQALGTAAREGIGAKFVVCNNRSYRILKYNIRQYWKDLGLPADQTFPAAFDLSAPSLRFDLLAEGQGVAAVRVEHPDQIVPAIERALSDDQPFLIDLVLSDAL
jgi:benzoylformate decarboxylase